MIKFIIENGAGPLFKVFNSRNIKIMEFLLQNGADINQKTPNGSYLLNNAIYQHYDFEIIKLFVKYGADVNSANGSPLKLTIGAYGDRSEQLKFLLDNGADVNYHSSNPDYTPLLSAVTRDKLALVKILLQYGADPTYKDSKGKSILDHARSQQVKQLLEEAIRSKQADASNNQNLQETNLIPPKESQKTNTSKFRNPKSLKRNKN